MIDTAAGARNHPGVFFGLLAVIGVVVGVAVWLGGGSDGEAGTAPEAAATAESPESGAAWIARVHHGDSGSVYASETQVTLRQQATAICRAWSSGASKVAVDVRALEAYPGSEARAAAHVGQFVVLATAGVCPTYLPQLAAGR